MLSDSESESSDVQLTINEHYAKAYAYKKEREELGRLKDKYGSDPEEDGEDDDDDSESGVEEDEDGEELTPAVDAAILRTLARIKRKDPDIYDKKMSIFEQEHKRTGQETYRPKAAKNNTKPLTIKQHALSSMLLTSGSRSPSPELKIITHDQEQSALRSETISAFHHALGDEKEDDDDDGLLVPREKTKDEVERAEEEYKAFLEREVGEDIRNLVTVEDEQHAIRETEGEGGGDETVLKEKKKKRRGGKKSGKDRQETDQEFLMNYILNRGWIDHSSKRVPTYKEVTHGALDDAPESRDVREDSGEGGSTELMEDDEFEQIVDQFESSYNHRFEEPDANVIQTHPRGIESAIRRPDTTRKEARERRKQRKQEELLKKKEEVKRLKALKMKELRQKIEKIGREGGVDIDTQAFADFDLDGDWDPDKHDSQMAEIYEEEVQEDIEKPQWDDDIDVGDIVPDTSAGPSNSKKAQKKKKKQKGDEVADVGVDVDTMDADVTVEQEDEEWDGTEEMRKRKVQEYMDEVYNMDFNDMVGDMPTRFKYTSVTPHSFALTPTETLLATDAELNEYMGIKKFAPYRKESKWDPKRANRLKEIKAKLKERSSGLEDSNGGGEENRKTKKRKGKKERQRAKATTIDGGVEDGNVDPGEEGEPPRKKVKRT